MEERLLEKLIDAQVKQSEALATLADKARRDGDQMGRIVEGQITLGASQERIASLTERIADSLDQNAARTNRAVEEVKDHVTASLSTVVAAVGSQLHALGGARSDRWVKILCALLGLIGALLMALVVRSAHP